MYEIKKELIYINIINIHLLTIWELIRYISTKQIQEQLYYLNIIWSINTIKKDIVLHNLYKQVNNFDSSIRYINHITSSYLKGKLLNKQIKEL